MNKITIDSTSNKSSIWLFVFFTIFGIGGYLWGILKTAQLNNLRKDYIRVELEKFRPYRDSINIIEIENTITLNDIYAKQIELKKLEEELKKMDTPQLSLEDALKIIQRK